MTIKEIAQLAGVSISTVSKIVNGKDQNINPDTRTRVLKIVKEYNYTPYGMIKNNSQTKTFIIGVLFRTSQRTNLMLNGILDAAQTHGYSIMIADSKDSLEEELKNITSLCKNKVDGIIWEPVSKDSAKNEHHFTDLNIPVVYFNTRNLSQGECINFSQLGFLLTEKLISYKHSRIACLLKKSSPQSQAVFNGYQKCLFENHIAYDENYTLYADDPDYIQKIISQNITAVVCSHFSSSMELYKHFTNLRHSIPADLSLVSLKDDIHGILSYPDISGIKIPYQEFGHYLCMKLIYQCEKNDTALFAETFTPSHTFEDEKSIDIPSLYRSKNIVVAGSINIDSTFNVDILPQAGKTTRIMNVTKTLGGKGANQAIGIAKFNLDVSLIGEIGTDLESNFIFDIFDRENVNTQGVHKNLKAQTGQAYIYIESTGESSITILPGANGSLTPQSIIDRREIFHNASYCLLSAELSIPVILQAAKFGKEFGAVNVLKPSSLRTLPYELIPYIDIFVPNKLEAALLAQDYTSVEEQAEYFFQKGFQTVIITLGHQGCYLRTKDITKFYPAAVFTPVDTTGGADAFISALVAYLDSGYNIDKAIQIATYAAGFCISRRGVVSALIDKGTLEAQLFKLNPELLEPA